MIDRPTAAVQLEMGCRLSTPPLKLAVGVCCGLMHSLRPYSRALAGLVAALLFSIHAIAYLRTGDASCLGGIPRSLAFLFASLAFSLPPLSSLFVHPPLISIDSLSAPLVGPRAFFLFVSASYFPTLFSSLPFLHVAPPHCPQSQACVRPIRCSLQLP